MAKAIMVQGTASGVGKSVIVAGLCRIFRNLGIRVAPFKAQNMALNSFITQEGGEIGRSQALQAEAAGVEPCNDMNPVLLKVASDMSSQVIFNGKVRGTMNADSYYSLKQEAWDVVTAAYDRLAGRYDLIVLEGAGSPAEINLRDDEIVNMKMARYAEAPVILVGDIDRGGVFASLYGTLELLKDPAGLSSRELPDADFIKAFIINKFRGDRNILRPGLRKLEDRTGRPVIGVVDYLGDLGVHEEDAIPEERRSPARLHHRDRPLKIVVLLLKYLSNFTDFDPFLYENDVNLVYSSEDRDIRSADLVIIPGSKNTVSDLLYLRDTGIERALRAAVDQGTPLIGICGGYQMLGKKLYDPHAVESMHRDVDGMGFLDTETTLDRVKTTCQVSAGIVSPRWFEAVPGETACRWNGLKGYEIHMGHTTGDVGLFKLKRVMNTEHRTVNADKSDDQNTVGSGFLDLDSEVMDGSAKDNVWGTYIHGLFDNDGLRTAVINSLRQRKGLPLRTEKVSYQREREKAIELWASCLQKSIDVCFILRQVGMEACAERMKQGEVI